MKLGRSRRRVVITGVGPVTPLGVGADDFWRSVMAARSATRAVETLPGGFPVESLLSRVTARVGDDELARHAPLGCGERRILLTDVALDLALADAGLGGSDFGSAAVVMGNAVGAAIEVEEAYRRRCGTAPRSGLDESLLNHLAFHGPVRHVADRIGTRGRLLTVSTGCTAGIDAIGMAFEFVRSGAADRAITGSAEAPLTPVVFAAFDRIGALSRRNHDPAGASRPFDRERDGFVLAEGAALLILEERSGALARGARIHAEIDGFCSISNGYHMTNMPPDGAALADCIRGALIDGGLPPDAVDHVNAHGSSTPQNDLCETNAIKAALGARSRRITVNSLKGMIGHALGASNAIEIVACALSMAAGWVFPTVNLREPGEGCDLDYVIGCGRRAASGHVLKLSSGFSGIHSALLLTEAGAGG